MDCNYFLPAGKTSLGATSDFPEEANPGIQFDALQDLRLNSVLVYFETPGARLISLEDSNGEEIDSKIVNATGDGQKRISLGFDLPQGDNYRLILKQGPPLLSDIEGAQFPYVLDDILSFDQSLAETVDQSLEEYHCFYDWEIEVFSSCGRLPVTVNVVDGDNIPTASFSNSVTELNLIAGEGLVEFTNTSEGATSFIWNFSDGTTDDTNESPVHIFTEPGTYTVSLTVINANGCSDTQTTEIIVREELLSSHENVDTPLWDITLFPNPIQDRLIINFSLDEVQNLSYRMIDVYGRSIINSMSQNYSNSQISLDVSQVSAGVYYIIFESKEQRMVRKVVKF